MSIKEHEGEKLVKTIRQSYMVRFRQLIVVLAIFTLGIFWLFVAEPTVQFGAIIIFLADFIYLFYVWYLWYFTVYVITTKRIMAVKRNSLFSKEVREIPLSKIIDVSYKIEGPINALSKIGDVELATSQNEMTLEDIKNPDAVRDEIDSLT
jgi:membrane protein YdbS with pleckstrin-like domain